MRLGTFLLLLFWSMAVLGQGRPGGGDIPRDQPSDFSRVGNDNSVSATDSTTKRNSFFDIFTGHPGKAAFYSLIIPGGGQFYNRRYWKVPIIVGGEAAAFWWLITNSQSYSEWRDAHKALLNDEIPSYRGVTSDAQAKIIRDGYLKNREYAYIIVIVAHLFNVFEAFIDRHLIDFDVSDDLSYMPRFEPSSSGLPQGLSLVIPLNKKKRKSLIPTKNLLYPGR